MENERRTEKVPYKVQGKERGEGDVINSKEYNINGRKIKCKK